MTWYQAAAFDALRPDVFLALEGGARPLLQFFPSSELTAAWTQPGTAPTFSHRAIHHRG